MSAIELFLTFPPLQRALLAALLVAVLCGAIGVYVVLRGLSMLGDGLAHVSFAGVALGLALGIWPLGLALVAAVVGALGIHVLREKGYAKGDAAIGILFTAGLATGVLVVSKAKGLNADVEGYLFGNLLLVSRADIWLVAALAVGLALALALFAKEFFYMTLSEEAAKVAGLPVGVLNVVFTAFTAAAIVVAARVVGILLVSALLVVPAVASLQLARSFRAAVALAIAFGAASVLAGTFAAAQWGFATGASIALASTILFAGAAAMGRARGA